MLSLSETIWLTLSVYCSLPTTDYPSGVNSRGQNLNNTSQSPWTSQSTRFIHSHSHWHSGDRELTADCCVVKIILMKYLFFLFGCFESMNPYILCGGAGISIVGIFGPIFFFNRMCLEVMLMIWSLLARWWNTGVACPPSRLLVSAVGGNLSATVCQVTQCRILAHSHRMTSHRAAATVNFSRRQLFTVWCRWWFGFTKFQLLFNRFTCYLFLFFHSTPPWHKPAVVDFLSA